MCCKENFIFVVISFHIFQAVSKPLTLVRLMRQASRAFNLNEHESERILYMLQTDWGGKPYHSLDYELKKQFGKKIYKISLDGGMTCPNRDGTLGTGVWGEECKHVYLRRPYRDQWKPYGPQQRKGPGRKYQSGLRSLCGS